MSREIGDILRLWQSCPGQSFALATLVRAQGSSYRLSGARMLIGEDGNYAGSLSGGCLEEEVARRARAVLRDGKSSLLSFDTRLRFGCHGKIEVLVEPVAEAFLRTLAQRQHERRPGRAATNLAENAGTSRTRWLLEGEEPDTEDFVQEITPPLQLLVIGEGTDFEALRRFSGALGWACLQLESISDLTIPLDQWTAALVKTHNYGRDFAALRLLLPMELRYVGLLGPRRRREQIFGDLLDIGVSVPKRLFAPAGHNLGGDSPESIALAVIAEIHAVFKDRPGNHLRDKRSPIHPERSKTDSDQSEIHHSRIPASPIRIAKNSPIHSDTLQRISHEA